MAENLESMNILGIMSGTSLDGLDLALCRFSHLSSNWDYRVIKAITLPYPADLSDSLAKAINLSTAELCRLDHQYGRWIGQVSGKFLSDNGLVADWIASHGHTIFHQPENRFSLQIGNGNDIAAAASTPVIFDFRSMDIALGGQGAPLVPAGDELLFGEYDNCLNLGGFSNISFKRNKSRIAFDICPVNMGLNFLANKLGFEYDSDGNSGRAGKIIPGILEKLNSSDFYFRTPPKSLGREWFIREILPILECNGNTVDVMRTFYEHISFQISAILNENKGKNVLITGGGAKNSFLIELLAQKTGCEIIIPGKELVDFKEAIIFAFLGYLRINNVNNVLSSVTGSSYDHCSGLVINHISNKKQIPVC